MANIKKHTLTKYWLILLCFILALSASLSVNETQARYNNTAVWNTVLHYETGAVSSNCLAMEEQIILLGELPEEGREVAFTLETSSQMAGELTWHCDAEEYLRVTMQVKQNGTAKEIEQGGTIRFKENTATEIIMTLTPTEEMLAQPHDAVEANVTVEFGDLSGIFRTTIAPVAEETTAPTEPEETTIPTEPEETTDPTETVETTIPPTPTESEGTTAPTEPPTTAPAGSEPTNAPSEPEGTTKPAETEAPTENGETIETPISASNGPVDTLNEQALSEDAQNSTPSDTPDADLESGEGMENLTPINETEDPTSEASRPEAEKNSRSVSESQGNENVHPGGALTLSLKTIKAFDPAQALPLLIQKPTDIPYVQIGLAKQAEEQEAGLKEFPAFTRYIWEGISYLLYDGGIIELTAKGVDEIPILLYFSETNIRNGAELAIGAQTLQDDTVAETAMVITKAGADLAELEDPKILMDTLHKTAGTLSAEDNTAFTLELPLDWVDLGMTVEYSVEMLNADESGVTYQTVDLDTQTIIVEYIQNQKNHCLTVSMGKISPPAGTYRLNMHLYYQGILYQEVKTLFWIQYT